MFKILEDLNIFNKISCFMLLATTIFIGNSIYFMTLLMLLLFIINVSNFNFKTLIIEILIIISYFLILYLPIYVYIYKTSLVILLIYFLISIISNKDRRYILELIFYRKNKNMKWLIKKLYYNKKKKENILEDSNFYLKKQAIERSKYDMNEIYLFSKSRYYKLNKKRTNFIKLKWSKNDNAALIICLILCFVALCV